MGVSIKGIGRAIKKGVKDVGHVVGKVASNPWVQGGLGLLTGGVTAPIIAGVAGGLTKPGGNIGQALKGGAQGALAGGAGKLVKGGIGAVAKGGIGGLISGTGADGKGRLGALGDLAGKVGGSGLGGLVGGGAGGGLNLGGIGLGDILDAGLGTAGLVNAAQLAGKSDQFANTAYNDVRQSFDARAPLRAAGIAGMLDPAKGVPLKLQGVTANAGGGNPFYKKPAGGVKL